MLQKYISMLPSSLQSLLYRSIPNDQMTWENLLQYLQLEIGLEDQVNKIQLTRPSIIDIVYYQNPDHRLNQKFTEVLHYIKRKLTNYIKLITKLEIYDLKLVVFFLQKQIIFYDCQQKKILQTSQFHYNNIQKKILKNLNNKQKLSQQIKNYHNSKKIHQNNVHSKQLIKQKNINNFNKNSLIKLNKTDKNVHNYYLIKKKQKNSNVNDNQFIKQQKQINNNVNNNQFTKQKNNNVNNNSLINFLSKTVISQKKKNISDSFVELEKKILEIQSVSFCQNFMLIALMNCELRLYQLKKTSNGFSEELIFQKDYNAIINYALIYRSNMRKFYNICITLSKFSAQYGEAEGYRTISFTNNNVSMKEAYDTHKAKQTEIFVYQLNSQMQIGNYSYKTFVNYSPIIVTMLPLGIGGYTQSGQLFIVQLNCTSSSKLYNKSIETTLYNPNDGKRVSISCMKCHKNLVNLYMGCKDGSFYVFDILSQKVRMQKKLSNSEIRQIMFLNGDSQVMFWDLSGKVGFFNSQTLIVNSVVSLISKMQNNKIDSGYTYTSIANYFIENQFLLYGNRTIGLISLFENEQKKFNIEKPMKIFNRRLALKNRRLQKNPTSSTSVEKSYTQPSKIIYDYFSTLQSMILITNDGEILVYDRTLNYVGSYFTLNYQTLVECLSCHDSKYLYFLHENNEMQIVNIYTQEKLISITNLRQKVSKIFFCHSSVYFCGYLTSKKYDVVIYGYPDERYAIRNANVVQPMIEISLSNLIVEMLTVKTHPQLKYSSQQSKLQKGRTKIQLNMIVEFYRGAMILINCQKAEVSFLYKKSFARNCVIKCQQIYQQATQKTSELLKIANICMLPQSSILSLLLSNNCIMLIQLQTKSIKTLYIINKNSQKITKLQTIDEDDVFNQFQFQQMVTQNRCRPILHYLSVLDHVVYILWENGRDQEFQFYHKNKYIYTVYYLQEPYSSKNIAYTTLLHLINSQPTQQIKQKLPKGKQWISSPFIISQNLLTINRDRSYINQYKIKKQKIKQNQKKKQYSKYKIINRKNSLEDSSQKKICKCQFQYFKIQPL